MRFLVFLFFLVTTLSPLYPQDNLKNIKKLAQEQTTDTRFYYEFLKMLIYLGMLIGFMLLITKYMKVTFTQKVQKLNEQSPIKIHDRRAISQTSTLMVVELWDKKILISESTNGVQKIAEYPK